MQITRPTFTNVPLAQGLRWSGGHGFRYEEKLDGIWHQRTIGTAVLVGELIIRTPSAPFYAFDVLAYEGRDLRPWPLLERLALLHHLESGPLAGAFLRPATGQGGEFLEAILARGGEGIVAKPLDAPYGSTWFKCKRLTTLDLRVSEKHAGGKSSLRLAELNGEDRGWCPYRAAFDQVQVGDIVEIAAFGLTPAGKLREPRFLGIRTDKMV